MGRINGENRSTVGIEIKIAVVSLEEKASGNEVLLL